MVETYQIKTVTTFFVCTIEIALLLWFGIQLGEPYEVALQRGLFYVRPALTSSVGNVTQPPEGPSFVAGMMSSCVRPSSHEPWSCTAGRGDPDFVYNVGPLEDIFQNMFIEPPPPMLLNTVYFSLGLMCVASALHCVQKKRQVDGLKKDFDGRGAHFVIACSFLLSFCLAFFCFVFTYAWFWRLEKLYNDNIIWSLRIDEAPADFGSLQRRASTDFSGLVALLGVMFAVTFIAFCTLPKRPPIITDAEMREGLTNLIERMKTVDIPVAIQNDGMYGAYVNGAQLYAAGLQGVGAQQQINPNGNGWDNQWGGGANSSGLGGSTVSMVPGSTLA